MRSTLTNHNLEIETDNTEQIQELKHKFKQLQNIGESEIVKLFYNGCEMDDQQQIGGYGLKTGYSIIVLVRKIQ